MNTIIKVLLSLIIVLCIVTLFVMIYWNTKIEKAKADVLGHSTVVQLNY